MNFISLCSGIEAASVAFGPLGWKAIAFSEIEGFPSAVLAHHYPTVRNYGDMSLFRDWPDELFADADAIVGGPPCQAFSCAGARRGLLDARGNLTLIYVELLNHADDIRRKYGKPPIVALYENVPGIFSDRTNAFGCLVGGLAGEDVPVVPPGKRWTDAGCVFGPERAVAWRLFDAQFFGLAQRRRRVFVVASAREGFDPTAVLFEFDGVRRDTAPSREARQVAPTIPSRSTAGGGLGTDFDCDGGLQVAGTMKACKDSGGWSNSAGHAAAGYMVPVGTFCVSTGQAGAEIGADMAPTLNCNHEAPYVAHSLRGEGFDASEDGTGRGTPLVPVAMINMQGSKGNAVAQADGPSFTLNAMHGHDMHAVAVPVGVTIHGTDPTVQKVASYDELAQCLRARTPGNIDNSSTTVVQQPVSYGIRTANTSSNGWGIQEEVTHTLDCAQGVAVAVALRGREGGATAELGDEVQNCLRASSGGGDKPHVLCETLYNKGFNHGGLYASTQETHAGKILRTLREAVGEEAFAQWGLGILGSLQSPEILRQALHGVSIRPAAFSRSWVVHCALSRSENGSGWLLQSLRETGCEGCPPQGWEPSEQLARELGAYLSELSQPGAQASRFVRDLWQAAQGPGVLRQALSAVQEVGRPAHGQGQPIHSSEERAGAAGAEGLQGTGLRREVPREGVLQQARAAGEAGDAWPAADEQSASRNGALGQTMMVRRLTCEEAEFLQGFPRGYTAIPWRKKPADQCPDGPRYKSLGNSWAVPNVRWIGQRIDAAVRRLR